MNDIFAKIKSKRVFKYIFDYAVIAIGAIIAAFAIEEFLVPSTILDGGVVGISIMINNLVGVPLSILTIVLNIPFLIVGSRKMGKMFIAKSAFAMVVFSIALDVFAPLVDATEEILLAVSFGGVILGIGVGLVIKFGGCLDGTETVAIMLNKRFGWQVGQTVLGFNVAIYATAGFLFGFDRAMYSLLTYFITSKVLDIVENGANQAKAAMIITDEPATVAEKLYYQLGRTATLIEGEGLVSGKKVILYCVMTKFEIPQLKAIIDSVESSSFITISDVSEIIGTHMKKTGTVEVEVPNLENN